MSDSVPESVAAALDPLESRHPLPPTANIDLVTQLTRFIVTGVLSAVVDFGLLLLLSGAGMNPVAAKSLAFVAGTTTAYLINRRWTFAAEPSRSRFLAVVGLYAVTFAVQVGVFTVLYHWLRDDRASEFIAKTVSFVVAQGIATTVNFLVQRLVIFRLR